MSFIVIVPARAASTRLPNKMLADIAGQPLVVHTAQRALQSAAQAVYIATDHPQIAAATEAYHIPTLMTAAHHPSGTDRLAEVVEQLQLDDEQIVVNVQGDEPLIDPQLINQVAQCLQQHPQAAIATAAYPIESVQAFTNPNIVKVICDQQQFALTFSRAPIPWDRQQFAQGITQLPSAFPALHHVGLYAYRASFLRVYPQLTMGQLERLEQLEQLRALEHGYRIAVLVTDQAPLPGVDTSEDLENIRTYFAQNV